MMSRSGSAAAKLIRLAAEEDEASSSDAAQPIDGDGGGGDDDLELNSVILNFASNGYILNFVFEDGTALTEVHLNLLDVLTSIQEGIPE